MKKKRLRELLIPILLVGVFAVAVPMSGCIPGGRAAPPAPPEVAPPEAAPPEVAPPELEPIKIGYIGWYASDIGRQSIYAAEIFVDEINAAGGALGGRPLVLVYADTGQKPEEGIKAMEYLVEVEDVDFIISGTIDDVSMALLPRIAEYQVPFIDSWTSAIRAIDYVNEEYDAYKCYFMTCMDDYFLGQGMVNFAKHHLNPVMGWETMVLFNEDTAYGIGTAELVMDRIVPQAGIEVLDHVVYDIDTVDFSPIFTRMLASDPDFIYQIASVNDIIPVAQYVEAQIPKPIAGIVNSAMEEQFWEDTGGLAAGYNTSHPHMGIGIQGTCDPMTQGLIDEWHQRHRVSDKPPHGERPTGPIFSGYSSYYGLHLAFMAAESVYAKGLGSGFEPVDAWVEAMETDAVISLYKGDELYGTWDFYGMGEYEPVTRYYHPHNCVYDYCAETGYGLPGTSVNIWYEDATYACVFPPPWANGEFEVPWWIAEAE